MAFTPNKYLIEDSTVIMRDQQHASRLFVDDQFRLAPKHNFLFHVAFSINATVCKDSALLQRHQNEINMLVKAVSLPSFTISTNVMNQYNRKKIIQYHHEIGEIDIQFHDDNMGLINKLWQNYYSYYYADSNAAASSSGYSKNATKNSNFINNSYGLDNSSYVPFFNYITIYQMARHEFVSYKLINPLITSWNHNKLDYSDNKVHDFSMKLKCEAIAYDSGLINNDSPEGFGVEHYDLTPSPLVGNQNNSSVSPQFADINAISSIDSSFRQINTYQNTQQLKTVTSVGNINNNNNQVISGIQGIVFPKTTTNNITVATPVKLG